MSIRSRTEMMGRREVYGESVERDRFRALYNAHYAAILNHVRRRLPHGSDSDAAYAVADVFLTAWRRLSSIPAPPDDLPWLYGVARRTISRSRRITGRRERLLSRLWQSADPLPTSDDYDERGDRVRKALSALRPRDREVLLLSLWDELNNREIAQALGCSPNAVAIRLHRARLRLSSLLEVEAAEPPSSQNRTTRTKKET
jgi:RNA polymerase sigma factor (sigma-70 family)